MGSFFDIVVEIIETHWELMELAMNDTTIKIFIEAVDTVLSSLAGMNASLKSQLDEGADSKTRGDLTGVIEMSTEEQPGSVAIGFSERLAVALTNKALGEDVTAITEDVENFVGEITNMICGGAKAPLQDAGIEVGFASPSLLKGKGQTIPRSGNVRPCLLTLDTPEGELYLELNVSY